MNAAPDLASSRAAYSRHARGYDRSFAARAIAPLQRRAVSALELCAGETVIDVACGTGLNFAGIQPAIGPTGRLTQTAYAGSMYVVLATKQV